MDGGREGSIRQRSVTSAAEQTGGDSWAPSFTTVIRSSRTAHHMGWHNLFIQSLQLHTRPVERGWYVSVRVLGMPEGFLTVNERGSEENKATTRSVINLLKAQHFLNK